MDIYKKTDDDCGNKHNGHNTKNDVPLAIGHIEWISRVDLLLHVIKDQYESMRYAMLLWYTLFELIGPL